MLMIWSKYILFLFLFFFYKYSSVFIFCNTFIFCPAVNFLLKFFSRFLSPWLTYFWCIIRAKSVSLPIVFKSIAIYSFSSFIRAIVRIYISFIALIIAFTCRVGSVIRFIIPASSFCLGESSENKNTHYKGNKYFHKKYFSKFYFGVMLWV